MFKDPFNCEMGMRGAVKCWHTRGVARVMNMCTHNARGTDLQSFSETGREWIFPYSWLLFYGGNLHTRCAQPSGHGGGGPGGLPRGKFEKKIANGGI